MALIKCKECGSEVSDKAKQCVKCGNPIKSNDEVNKKVYVDKKNYIKPLLISVIPVLLIFDFMQSIAFKKDGFNNIFTIVYLGILITIVVLAFKNYSKYISVNCPSCNNKITFNEHGLYKSKSNYLNNNSTQVVCKCSKCKEKLIVSKNDHSVIKK